ncbi:helix-turn-helix domain-containing protein [Streptomyces natalensis]|uniref:DNA-binding protein n=1 Tax=Streptomyces natalensis ATCC 27448 TaxID=1240678 RepID=A0A0D7CH69_9ACTN|nr:helix-turn-helix domain-containing protein [Streptomyces natalensis]KIZ15391.1 DNA-binding protein [Streptomyces natalensis ATCC 27448]
MGEHDDAEAVGPIGARVVAWRRRRGMTRDALASHTRLSASALVDLETGRDWIDRRGRLTTLAAALRLDTGELTGQPYPPTGNEHAAVRAVAFHLRRQLAQTPGSTGTAVSIDDLDARTTAARAAAASGDEHSLALALPELVQAADQAVTTVPATGQEVAVRLRVDAHVLAAGLLRRTGYKDLAWMLLHRALPGTSEPLPILVEEVRLLIDLGLPEYALARAARAQDAGAHPDLPALAAVAHAMAGRRRQAEDSLAAAAQQAADGQAEAQLSVARAAVAVEDGAFGEAADHARAADQAALPTAVRARLLTFAATAEARHGRTTQAVAHLVAAEAAAPLRLRLDPFAREVIAGLAARTSDTPQAEAMWNLAGRVGLR